MLTRTVLDLFRRRLDRLDAEDDDANVDRARWAWYAESCPCGLPPGECREHPRARPNQRPPEGVWRAWLMLMGRGAGKTRSGAEWVCSLAAAMPGVRIALVGATAADVRDVMVGGESGILAISPPWLRPTYLPSIRRLEWPNGTTATTFSAEEPDRLRGPQAHFAWCDELAAWKRPEAWSNLMFGLRLGTDPRVCITTTPRPTKLVKDLVNDSTTAVARGSTYENKANLAPTFFERVVSQYEGTRLGAQELLAEIIETSEGAWFANFDPASHVSDSAEFDHRFGVHVGIDAGTSRTTAAVFFQVRPTGDPHRHKITVFGEYLAVGLFSEANARGIHARAEELPCRGRLETIRIDPASNQRTGIGVTAYQEYERVFGSRILARSPYHKIADGLDQIEGMLDRGDLVIHPRCSHLKAAFMHYQRARRGGEWLDEPAADQSPFEDAMDALRYGIRSRFPEGRIDQRQFQTIPARKLF